MSFKDDLASGKVVAIEKGQSVLSSDHPITTKYRGSFNTLWCGEIKLYSGSLKDGRLDLVLSGFPAKRRRFVPSLGTAVTDFGLGYSETAG